MGVHGELLILARLSGVDQEQIQEGSPATKAGTIAAT